GAVIAVLSEAGAEKGGAAPVATGEKAAPKPAAEPASAAPEKPAARPRPPAQPRPREAATAEEASEPPEGAPESRGPASPLARRIARDRGVALEGITGTGPGGRIVERDVEQVATATKRAAPAEAPARPRPVAAVARPAAAEPAVRRVELGKVRRTTAKRMAEAERDSPHLYARRGVSNDQGTGLEGGAAEGGGQDTGL